MAGSLSRCQPARHWAIRNRRTLSAQGRHWSSRVDAHGTGTISTRLVSDVDAAHGQWPTPRSTICGVLLVCRQCRGTHDPRVLVTLTGAGRGPRPRAGAVVHAEVPR